MIAHLRSFVFTIIFLCGVETIISFSFLDNIWGAVGAGLLLLVSFFAGWNVGKKILYAFLPCALAMSSLGLLYFIDNTREQQIFGVIVSMLYYTALLGIKRIRKNPLDMTARSLFSAALISTIFIFYAVAYGTYINFNIPLWLFILVHFVFVTMITLVSLRAYSSDMRRVFLYALTIGFAMMQLVWMANFWPFSYLTTATVSLMFYYVLWDLVQMVFLGTLSKRRIVVIIIYCTVLTLSLLLTAQWLLVY